MVALDSTIVAAANPVLGAELHANLQHLQWITNSYLLVMAPAMVLAGRLGDRFGRRRAFVTGVIGFVIASVVIGLAGSVEVVIAARAAQGLFGGLVMTNAMALLKAAVSADRLARAVSVFGAFAASSIVTGPILGGVVVDQLGWRWAFFINVPIALVGLAIRLPKPERADAGRFDVLGAVVLTLALVALAYGLVQDPWWLVAVVPLGVVFVLVERAAVNPVMPLRLLNNPGIALTAVTDFAMIGLPIYVTLFLQRVDGYTPFEAAMRLVPLGVGAIAGSSISAWLLPRRGVAFAGALVSTAGFLAMTGIEVGSSYARLAVPFAALGLGLAMVMNAAIHAVLSTAAESDAGVVSGVQQAANQIGGLLGTSVLGAVLASTATGRFANATGVAELDEATARAVSQGIAPIAPGADVAVTRAANEAFLSGIHTLMWICAGLSLASCVFATKIHPIGRVSTTPNAGGEK